jgi:uncharacterized protein (DUF3820 family)
MPFGRYKGKPLAEVPASYLLWLARECKLSSNPAPPWPPS